MNDLTVLELRVKTEEKQQGKQDVQSVNTPGHLSQGHCTQKHMEQSMLVFPKSEWNPTERLTLSSINSITHTKVCVCTAWTHTHRGEEEEEVRRKRVWRRGDE